MPDTMETFFDSRVDLLQRRLVKQTEKLKSRADTIIKTTKVRTPRGEDLDREVQKIRLKVHSISGCIFDNYQLMNTYR
jgi:hypothetical protein